MMRRLLMATILALALAATAQAEPFHLAWDQCLSEGGTQHKYFACDTNVRVEALVGSFVPQATMTDFVALSVVLDGQTAGHVDLPDWWQLYNPGSCRQTALSCSFDFTTFPNVSCMDPWQGLAQGGVAAYYTAAYPPPPPQTAPMSYALRIKVAGALTTPVQIDAGTEYYAFRLAISHAKSTGADACAGCATGVCLLVSTFTPYSDAGGPVTLVPDRAPPGSPYTGTEYATWECAEGQATGPEPFELYCAPIQNCSVPVVNRTWGSIKALYR